jgi:hypothetical protein
MAAAKATPLNNSSSSPSSPLQNNLPFASPLQNNLPSTTVTAVSYPNSSAYAGFTPPAPETSATSVYAIQIEENYRISISARSVQPIDIPNSPHSPRTPSTTNIVFPESRITTHQNNENERTLLNNFMTVHNFTKTAKCLIIIDLISIILSSIFNLYWLFFLWGPICGYYGITKFRLYFAYCYGVYWILRILCDLLYILTGHWMHIVLILVDVYVLRYLRIYILALKTLSSRELEALRVLQRYLDSRGWFSN